MSDEWPDRFWDWATTSGIRIVAIILGAVLFYFIFRALTRKLLHVARKVGEKSDFVTREQEMRARTLAGIVRGLIVAVLIVVVSITVLKELGYDVAPLLAGAGIAGIAIGFGAQTLVRDVIGGFFILLEGQFYIGDIVHVGTIKGRVENIKLRTTLIRDGEGVLHVIPNGEMRIVANLTKGWSRVVLDFDVDYHEDIDKVMDIIATAARKAAADSRVAEFVIDAPEVQGVESVAGPLVSIRLVARTAPFKDPEVAREMRLEVLKALRGNDITLGASAE